MKEQIKVVLDFSINDVEFDYKKIKKMVLDIFNESIDLQVQEFENVKIIEEDFFIEVSSFNYDDGEGGDYYHVSVDIDDEKRGKELDLEISGRGDLSKSKLEEALNELFVLAKAGIKEKIIS